MNSKNNEKYKDRNEDIELDLIKFLKFINRNKYLMLIIYFLSFFPGIFIPYKYMQKNTQVQSYGIVLIDLLEGDNSNKERFGLILENIKRVDPYEEVQIIKNKSTLWKIYKDIYPKRELNYENFDNNLLIKLENHNGITNRIKIQFKDQDTGIINNFMNSIIRQYKSESFDKKKKRLNSIYETLSSRRELYKNKVNKLRSNNIKNYDKKIALDPYNQEFMNSIELIELSILTLPSKSWSYISTEIIENKVNKLRVFMIFNFLSIMFILIFVFLKERYYGPYNSIEIIESFLKINFIEDLSNKDKNNYDEILSLSNLKTDKKLFSNDIVLITLGENNFKDLEKFRTRIMEKSSSKIVISKNIYDCKNTDKIVLLKNNNPIYLKDIQKLIEKIKYLDNEILGWFIIN